MADDAISLKQAESLLRAIANGPKKCQVTGCADEAVMVFIIAASPAIQVCYRHWEPLAAASALHDAGVGQ